MKILVCKFCKALPTIKQTPLSFCKHSNNSAWLETLSDEDLDLVTRYNYKLFCYNCNAKQKDNDSVMSQEQAIKYWNDNNKES